MTSKKVTLILSEEKRTEVYSSKALKKCERLQAYLTKTERKQNSKAHNV